MLILPAIILLASRKKMASLTKEVNPHRSPVGQVQVVYTILAFSVIFIGVVTYNNVSKIVAHYHK
jgi:hypothetical protein